MEEMDSLDLLALALSIILPPAGVFLKVGLTTHFWINIILTIFGFYIFGVVHAIYVVLKK
jgi:uncharacterized membrane protein YqaE (UPF0057 family)